MIRMLTAYTREIDEVETSVSEILEQLDLEHRLLASSVGILSFHPDFLESGVVRALADALPFDTVGGTSSNVSIGGAMGGLMLVVTVLTSDDVVFRTGVSRAIADDPDGAMRELYARVAPPEMGRPSLLFVYAPVLDKVSGDDLVRALDAASGCVPQFGSLATTHLPDFSGIETCANGEHHADALALVAFFGDVSPKFYLTGIPEDRVIRQRATITSAVKNRIQRINNLLPTDYLESVGLAENGDISGIASFPFVLTLTDGSKVARSVYKTTDEGHILAFGDTPEGAELDFSDSDAEFIINSTGETAAHLASTLKTGNVLIFSCAGRRWVLGVTTEREMEEVARRLGDSFASQFAYSGGEICPVKNRDGRQVNRFHNFSMVACAL